MVGQEGAGEKSLGQGKIDFSFPENAFMCWFLYNSSLII
jgi:hypothetical protein